MAVKLRLTRMGRKKKPFYRIIAIDSRSPRDGRYLENLGYYNPLPNPHEIRLNEERVLYWLNVGATPSDTVRSLFRQQGVLFKWDLLKRGLSQEQMDQEMKRWEVIQLERSRKTAKEKIEKTEAKTADQVIEEPAKGESQETVAAAEAQEQRLEESQESGEAEEEKE